MTSPRFSIVGTGAMGQGIALIAAQAGSTARLFDTRDQAAQQTQAALHAQWDRLVAKDRISADAVAAHKSRLALASQLIDLADCDLVIEAIIERLDLKQALFAELKSIVSAQTVLATNTSSRSVTTMGAGLQHPGRFAGYHFFNPVPLMKVVEVVAGLKIDAVTCQALSQYAQQMGHLAVNAGHTPGFIVNHVGRGYGPANVLEVLFNLQTVYGDPRNRPSPWLRRRGAIGLSLLHEEN